jgi:hypothetical protein
MPKMLQRLLFIAFLLPASTVSSHAAPVNSRLLPLVPPEANIVAGIEDPHNPNSHGRLLFVTRNNCLDFDDWLSLSGVDADRRVDEFIEVAASSPRGELKERLLLVAGRFDAERIVRAAQQNSATTTEYRGATLLEVKPFAREQRQISDTRWMAFPDPQTAIFGTPWLVQRALDRFAAGEPAEARLVEQLGRLHPDVNSWNVLFMTPDMLVRHVAAGQSNAPWVQLLTGADELALGIHYGGRARIDFAIRTTDGRQASSVASLLAQPSFLEVSSAPAIRPRVEALSLDLNQLQGSIILPGKQLDGYIEDLRSGAPEVAAQQSR